MNLKEARKLALSWKVATWSNSLAVRKYEAPKRRHELEKHVRSGLTDTSRQWRGDMGDAGKPNRSQRKHLARGGSLYRGGFHWIIAANLKGGAA
jgi:hypothetical protein